MKMKTRKRVASALLFLLFVIAQAVLFPLIQLTPGDVSASASYLSIIVVALFVIIACKCRGADHLVRLGLLLTLVADYFLVLSDDKQIEGVAAFAVVQLCYCFYLIAKEERLYLCVLNTLTRIILAGVLIACAFVVLGADTDALSLISVIYYANLVTNMIFAFALGKGNRIFAIGLVLFAMCDLCIGLEILATEYLDSDVFAFFYGENINLPWVFYQPSQVLIALSLFKGKQK